jgi:hypothetical protein
MSYSLVQVLIPFVAVMFNVVVQILSCKFLLRGDHQTHHEPLKTSVVLGIFSGIICVIVQEVIVFYFIFRLFRGEMVGMTIVNLLVCLAFSYWYVVFITFGETALRTRVLMEIDKVGELSEQEILARYNAQELTKIRIDRLVNTGQIEFRQERYFGTNSLLVKFAKCLGYMHLVIFGHKGDYQ